MPNYSNAVNTMVEWMHIYNTTESEINAIYIGADMEDADKEDFADTMGWKEATLAEIGSFLNTHDDIKQAALNYLPDGWEDEDIHPLVETGNQDTAASALYFRAESYASEQE